MLQLGFVLHCVITSIQDIKNIIINLVSNIVIVNAIEM